MEPKRIREWAELVFPWLPPAVLAAAATACKLFNTIAASITTRRSADATRGLERYPIPFSNPIDSQPYSYFLYSRSAILRSPSSQPWGGAAGEPLSDPSSFSDLASVAIGSGSGCQCRVCDPEGCPCWITDSDSGVGMGLLRECGFGCGCGSDCGNRATQLGVRIRVKVVKDEKKGWGLHADQFVMKGSFICEYAGEYLTTEEARKRQKSYDELATSKMKFSPALIVVREHLPSGKACLRVNIDATKVGNVARFINHSCDGGNLISALVRNSGSMLPRLCFFAAIDLMQDQELTFSYGDVTRVKVDAFPCFCGTDACFGVLPSEET
ncbi:LOW QUALITY PROTEIN: histone-lysine N-methyltransferase SUVR3 [Dioscorea cayenensis subsp. rotundata]|uniref:LOW QUALITY PROTEIN: histone-lysine N-methyltransferase SUVR3 n=1 Tax=Dioscorea cayennensis subsp. rotundata TaxID=55577 RepID=A0AB40CM42_DIOCR|nr:LOW QUALITY PROTEIN: histone-lysine N-methyltransferase SUVR3 [Dioscorea cayenensis subsp. rotundata]